MPALQPQPDLITIEQYEALPEDKRKVNIYEDLLINFSEIADMLNI